MSNFLKNLAKRGAGLPVSAEYSPRPSTGPETRFGSRERPPEIASEEASHVRNEAPLSIRAQPMNPSSTSATSQARPSSAMAASTPRQPLTPEPTTVFQLSSPEPEPLLRPSSTEIARGPVSDHIDETPEHLPEVNEHGPAPVTGSVEAARQSIRVESKRQATTRERLEQQVPLRPGPLRPEVLKAAVHENAQEEPQTNQVIRPAATESSIPLQFPKVAPAQSQSPGTVPIYVRVGRVEIRGTPQPEPARSLPQESTPLGFASYQRMRRYRS